MTPHFEELRGLDDTEVSLEPVSDMEFISLKHGAGEDGNKEAKADST